MADDNTVQVQITGDSSDAEAAIARAKQSVEGLRGSITNISDALSTVKAQFTTAFEVTGITVAYEALSKVTSILKGFGDEAIQVRNMADILGVTVEQFQALKVAAEESGVSIQMMSRSLERVNILLDEARSGTATAIDKLVSLGLTTEQINDPTMTFNDALQILHQRLVDPATAAQTMNALVKEFGARAAQAAEALKNYSAEARGFNALSAEQNKSWADTGVAITRVETGLKNTAEKALLFAGQAASLTGKLLELSHVMDAINFAGNLFGINISKSSAEAAAGLDKVTISAQRVAAVSKESVEAAKLEAEETKAGSSARIAALQRYISLAQQYYGRSDVDAVKKGTEQLIVAERELADARARFLEQWASEYQAITSRNTLSEIEANTRVDKAEAESVKYREQKLEELSNFAEHLYQRTTREATQSLKELQRANAEQVKVMEQSYSELGRKISGALTSAFSQMMNGTFTFTKFVRNLITQMGEALIQTWVRNAIHYVATERVKAAAAKETATQEKAAAQDSSTQSLSIGGAAALKKVANDAIQAATGAFNAIVGIPYVGPFLAPVAAAGAFAAVTAYESGIVSAAGGYDIPRGLSPTAILHSGEMVLPEKHADVIRNVADSNQQQSRGNHVTVQGMGAGNFITMHKGEFTKMLKQLNATFALR